MKTNCFAPIGIGSLLSMIASASAFQFSTSNQVPATADLWLAGVDSSVNLSGDTIANANPFQYSDVNLSIFQGGTVEFQASGSWSNDPVGVFSGPEGLGSITTTGFTGTGFGNFAYRMNGLIGVFTDETPFGVRVTPADSVGIPQSGNLFETSINSPFYIGTGLNDLSGAIQFRIPSGATRLYLGIADIAAMNNPGSMTVAATFYAPVPEPSACAVGAGVALACFAMHRRIRR
jgi:hypothetical protein